MTEPAKTLRICCVTIILAAFAFVVADSVMRMRTIDAVTDFRFDSTRPLAEDSHTPSGYEGNQHNLVDPSVDAEHWLLQTQLMLSGGGARIRWVDYDGPPDGRAVHWSSFLRWAAVVPAWVDGKLSHHSVAQSAERVYPWVNTACFGILLIALLAIGVRRFGWFPATLLLVGLVTVHPFYDGYTVGNFDHHGLAASCALLTVLFLIAGGAGWVRTASATEKQLHAAQRGVAEWLPAIAGARAWFIASGIAGGAGLWISAATQAPALVGAGIGGMLAMTLAGAR